ncbi:tRNA (uridine(54)-C5)-methyltransferase TrmA [Pasteurella atlantica]|uniref:tRNA (Uridine(54)-C5)-methyltransferase TrmA n=2 Tax=Pasteurellaceae TaxID=712 RepID=A0ACC6HLG5_9PAST|nr:tRNA (uridine(54)-C5)-methyltransferase TrmA [Pasteurella atlantica]MDP8051648.1 tRNA (uridine(54)-C5)-methyltransferase TrmA [Pasteurella atlantica]MDP8100933.1 tRNA (uridine(54)-C5)-methyltransferase TrmA [Pasteurella atlantica]MDP8105029.1 tRNA (uridine(54)-C5)-methyltransferase TrmA [Pasteurella atlantica]MDP8148306.1 tRNA (uridine(54)-C5)-methyltransferase TrmA [Pasteurella atlantica]
MTLQIEQYPQLFAKKVANLTALLAPFNPPCIEAFESETHHFRLRAEFRIWHNNDDLYHIMFDQQTKQRYRVDQFPIGSLLINQMMTALLDEIRTNDILRHRLFQVDYLTSLSGQIVVSMLYHKKLDENWTVQAKLLKQNLIQQGFDVQLVGRATKQKIVIDRDYVEEKLTIDNKEYIYRQVENSFTQPNAKINIKMLEWARSCTANSEGDLLELYCGNGNFSIALASQFRKVLATEISKSSVASAQYNIEQNQIDNLQIIRMSAEEFTQALNGVREFNRLKGIELSDYQCNTIFVDPPRAGLDQDTLNLVQNYERILYISCNPHTLCENLEQLSQTHRIERCALFDQFPYTDHIESGVWLLKK